MTPQNKEKGAVKTNEERNEIDLKQPDKDSQSSGNSSTDIISNIRQNAGNNDAAREMVPDNDGH